MGKGTCWSGKKIEARPVGEDGPGNLASKREAVKALKGLDVGRAFAATAVGRQLVGNALVTDRRGRESATNIKAL